MFYDEVKVNFKAGNGGDGCFSFRRGKYEPKGGPDGGNGGRGGAVYIIPDTNVADLTDYHYKPGWKAKNGEPGRGAEQHGARLFYTSDAADALLSVNSGGCPAPKKTTN